MIYLVEVERRDRTGKDAIRAPRVADSLLGPLRLAETLPRKRAPAIGTDPSDLAALLVVLESQLLERLGAVLRHRRDRVVHYLQMYIHVLHVAINREPNLSGQDLARREVRHVACCGDLERRVTGLFVVLEPQLFEGLATVGCARTLT